MPISPSLNIQNSIKFTGFTPDSKTEKLVKAMTVLTCQTYGDKYFGQDQLLKIEFLKEPTDYMKQNHYFGLCWFQSGLLQSLWYGSDPLSLYFTFSIMTMEIDHLWFYRHLLSQGRTQADSMILANDFVHYAANAGWINRMTWPANKNSRLAQIQYAMRYGVTSFDILSYDNQRIISNATQIVDDIKSGKAPVGQIYWITNASTITPAEEDDLHVFDSLYTS
jgi:hypothetical protein